MVVTRSYIEAAEGLRLSCRELKWVRGLSASEPARQEAKPATEFRRRLLALPRLRGRQPFFSAALLFLSLEKVIPDQHPGN
jgi:hypothetical protein